MNNPISLDQAKAKVTSLKKEGKTVVFTNGCFDLIHAGHVAYLEQARSLGDFLIVGLNSDRSVQTIKGPLRPLVPQLYRAQVLSAFRMVDSVVIFDEETPIPTLKALEPHIHVKGGDYIKEKLPEYETVMSYGGTIKILSFVDGLSTSAIIQKILKSHVIPK